MKKRTTVISLLIIIGASIIYITAFLIRDWQIGQGAGDARYIWSAQDVNECFSRADINYQKRLNDRCRAIALSDGCDLPTAVKDELLNLKKQQEHICGSLLPPILK